MCLAEIPLISMRLDFSWTRTENKSATALFLLHCVNVPAAVLSFTITLQKSL